MRVEILDEASGHSYDSFLKKDPHSLFFASNAYRVLLKRFLDAEDRYLLALNESGDIQAVLPLFICHNDRLGPVVNSLPFYGSHGAVIVSSPEVKARDTAKTHLIKAYLTLLEKLDCVAATLITSPFEEQNQVYKELLEPTFIDRRIGQLTPLPSQEESVEERLMALYHQKTRNLVRKGIKSGFDVTADSTRESLDFLIQTHHENMKEIGGKPKPESFFRLIPECFEYGSDYRIYCAHKGGQPVAALLTFYFNRTVEYFTPVIRQEYRSEQPLSLLIYLAMVEAAKAGFAWWNWGGTWVNQDSVYHFKKRWGTEDKPYYYYIKVCKDSILRCQKDVLLEAFPYFFVAPFEQLAS